MGSRMVWVAVFFPTIPSRILSLLPFSANERPFPSSSKVIFLYGVRVDTDAQNHTTPECCLSAPGIEF
jgi:hypothetical protein